MVFKDSQHDLTKVMKILKHVPLILDIDLVIQKIINLSIYMGRVANQYLMSNKGKNEEAAEKIVPEYCLYTAYTFHWAYEPQNPKPHAKVILDYDYAFWGSPLAQAVWSECFDNLHSLNIVPFINNWTEFFTYLDGLNYKKITTMEAITINLTSAVFQVIYNFNKYINDLYTSQNLTDTFIDYAIDNIKAQYDTKVNDIIFLTPLIDHRLYLKRTSPTGAQVLNERERQLIPTPIVDNNALTVTEIDVYHNTWCLNDRVTITDAKLNIKPYRYDPP